MYVLRTLNHKTRADACLVLALVIRTVLVLRIVNENGESVSARGRRPDLLTEKSERLAFGQRRAGGGDREGAECISADQGGRKECGCARKAPVEGCMGAVNRNALWGASNVGFVLRFCLLRTAPNVESPPER